VVFHVGEAAYDDFMGRYSTRLAVPFAEFAGVREGMRVLDVGAGTGALTRELVARVGAGNVAAAEPSKVFEQALRTRFPEVDVRRAPAEELPFPDGEFEIALAQLVVAFVQDAPAAMRELRRVARTVAICMWGVDEVEMFAAINRTARVIASDGAEPFARRYRTAPELVELLTGAGLADVETAELDVTASYSGYDEFWRALEGQVGPSGAWLQALDGTQRAAAREEMFRQLGSPAGAFALDACAFAARATRA
jgi:ubiquinone/menaquinone biosynthesis C-methylase UbiE